MNGRQILLLVVGICSIVAPRRVLTVQARINTIGFDGTDSLEPRGWLVTLTRLVGVVTILIVLLSRIDGDDRERTLDTSDPAG